MFTCSLPAPDPTALPVPAPSAKPTPSPSPAPSVSPLPSQLPTSLPTPSPSGSPLPSVPPTPAPTIFPTIPPTFSFGWDEGNWYQCGDAGGGNATARPGGDRGYAWLAVAATAYYADDEAAAVAGGSVGSSLVFVGGGGDSPYTYSSEVSSYDWVTSTWTALPDMPFASRWSHAAVIDSTLFVVGGGTPSGSPPGYTDYSAMLLGYDIAAGSWSVLPPMPEGKQSFGAVATAVRLYTFGGRGTGRDAALDGHYAYEPAASSWTAMPPMPCATYYMTAASDNGEEGLDGGKLFSVGGQALIDGRYYNSGVWMYDVPTSEWSSLPDMPFTFYSYAPPKVAVDAHRNTLIAWGGISPIGIRYDGCVSVTRLPRSASSRLRRHVSRFRQRPSSRTTLSSPPAHTNTLLSALFRFLALSIRSSCMHARARPSSCARYHYSVRFSSWTDTAILNPLPAAWEETWPGRNMASNLVYTSSKLFIAGTADQGGL